MAGNLDQLPRKRRSHAERIDDIAVVRSV